MHGHDAGTRRRRGAGRGRAVGLAGVLLCAAALAAGGCVSGDAQRQGPQRQLEPREPLEGAGPDAAWPFWPQRMRVHPLTQFVHDRSSGDLLLEARVEFFDQFGHTSKAAGLLLLGLYDAASTQFDADPIMRWESDLADVQTNGLQYDEVTRTYLFRLEIADADRIPPESDLEAHFHTSNGGLFQATYRLKK